MRRKVLLQAQSDKGVGVSHNGRLWRSDKAAGTIEVHCWATDGC
jgi:hypothetical protein